MHPTLKSYVLMLSLRFGFFEGDSGMIAVSPAQSPLRVIGIKPSL
jgi:hypothetical protein